MNSQRTLNTTLGYIEPRHWILPAKGNELPENVRDHDDIIKWKHFPCDWPFLWGIHRWLVNSPHEGQWRGALIFFYLHRNKRLSEQWWGWWFEMPSCPLWCHCNDYAETFPFQPALPSVHREEDQLALMGHEDGGEEGIFRVHQVLVLMNMSVPVISFPCFPWGVEM